MTLPLELKFRSTPFEESYFYEMEILKVVSEEIYQKPKDLPGLYYTIDIPESELIYIHSSHTKEQFRGSVTRSVIIREAQKVFFRLNFSA